MAGGRPERHHYYYYLSTHVSIHLFMHLLHARIFQRLSIGDCFSFTFVSTGLDEADSCLDCT